MPCGEISYTETWNGPCSCCCRWFGCFVDDVKEMPDTLSFVDIIAGSCPLAATTTVSGTLVYDGDNNSCADLEAAEDCESAPQLCGCGYHYNIPEGTWPDCGPYLASISFVCQDAMVPEGSSPGGCVHATNNTCYWKAVRQVNRTFLAKRAKLCPSVAIDEGTGLPIYRHFIQSGPPNCDDELVCVDCPTPGVPCDDVCDPDCPHCLSCHDRCVALIDCCGTTGCELLPIGDPGSDGYYENFNGTAGMVDPPILDKDTCLGYCGATNYPQYRRYTHRLRTCQSPDDLVGCSQIGCPPDPKNLGNFGIVFSYCGNDSLHIFCTPSEMERHAHLAAMAAPGQPETEDRRKFKTCRHWGVTIPGCTRCAHHEGNPAYNEAVHLLITKGGGTVVTKPKNVTVKKGVGTEQTRIFKELGVGSRGCAACEELEAEMNRLGPDECEKKVDHFAHLMRERAKSDFSRWDKLKAAKAMYSTGYYKEVYWLDPFPGLIRLAIAAARRIDACPDS